VDINGSASDMNPNWLCYCDSGAANPAGRLCHHHYGRPILRPERARSSSETARRYAVCRNGSWRINFNTRSSLRTFDEDQKHRPAKGFHVVRRHRNDHRPRHRKVGQPLRTFSSVGGVQYGLWSISMRKIHWIDRRSRGRWGPRIFSPNLRSPNHQHPIAAGLERRRSRLIERGEDPQRLWV